MKVATRDIDHRIPLSPEIAAELRQWREIFGSRGFTFPSPQGGKHIGRESIEKVYRVTLKLEGKHSPHGWRSAFSTLARDQGFAREVVELALDHAHDNDVARAYDRGERFTQRGAVQLVGRAACSSTARGKNHSAAGQDRDSGLMAGHASPGQRSRPGRRSGSSGPGA